MPFKKAPKPKLIDDSGLAIQRVKLHVPKPDYMFRSARHLAWIRTLQCENCKATGCEAAHLRYGTQTPKGETPHDFWAWPGCPKCHRSLQHVIGEKTFWLKHCGVRDPHTFILVKYAIQSPCPRTSLAGKEEFTRRHAA